VIELVEQVKKTHVLPTALSTRGDYLNPALNVERRVVEQQHTDLIDRLNAS